MNLLIIVANADIFWDSWAISLTMAALFHMTMQHVAGMLLLQPGCVGVQQASKGIFQLCGVAHPVTYG
jgi:hypothetical protein